MNPPALRRPARRVCYSPLRPMGFPHSRLRLRRKPVNHRHADRFTLLVQMRRKWPRNPKKHHIADKLPLDLSAQIESRAHRAPAIEKCAVTRGGATNTATCGSGLRAPSGRGQSWLNACGGRAGRLELCTRLVGCAVVAVSPFFPSNPRIAIDLTTRFRGRTERGDDRRLEFRT